MLLRKHLQGGRISAIRQKDSERIVEIFVDTINELGFSVNKKLIVEIMESTAISSLWTTPPTKSSTASSGSPSM
jgi:predicted ribosome quality control (RQC) complex YloA/Tae2 family protein